jgi:hypothetical protein
MTFYPCMIRATITPSVSLLLFYCLFGRSLYLTQLFTRFHTEDFYDVLSMYDTGNDNTFFKFASVVVVLFGCQRA